MIWTSQFDGNLPRFAAGPAELIRHVYRDRLTNLDRLRRVLELYLAGVHLRGNNPMEE